MNTDALIDVFASAPITDRNCIDNYGTSPSFFLDRDALQKLLLVVGPLDFEKVRALYGMCRENYRGIRHERFRLCMRKIVERENLSVTPIRRG
jgi:hypothetical protein